jgi:competence ComEA-like helix-hairpin-helix protein
VKPDTNSVRTSNFLWSRRFGIQKPYRPAQQIKVGEATVAVQFSPASSKIDWQNTANGLIANLLAQAEQSIDLALFVFSEQALVNAIEPQSQKGILIRALIEPSFMYRPYSEGLDMLGVSLSDRCKEEPHNRPWQTPIKTVGVPQLPPGDMLHHKFGIVDRHTVLTGSHNWTPAANQNNDETLLAIRSPIVAAHFQQEFERLYANATLGIPPAIQRKIDTQRKQCPSTIATPSTGMMNLNTATLAELETLPGVGKGLANRIIDARPIHSLEDLDRVPGVGSKLLERIRDRVTW